MSRYVWIGHWLAPPAEGAARCPRPPPMARPTPVPFAHHPRVVGVTERMPPRRSQHANRGALPSGSEGSAPPTSWIAGSRLSPHRSILLNQETIFSLRCSQITPSQRIPNVSLGFSTSLESVPVASWRSPTGQWHRCGRGGGGGGWTEHVAPTGDLYWHHAATGRSSWVRPPARGPPRHRTPRGQSIGLECAHPILIRWNRRWAASGVPPGPELAAAVPATVPAAAPVWQEALSPNGIPYCPGGRGTGDTPPPPPCGAVR